jgi:hypothetical protein
MQAVQAICALENPAANIEVIEPACASPLPLSPPPAASSSGFPDHLCPPPG